MNQKWLKRNNPSGVSISKEWPSSLENFNFRYLFEAVNGEVCALLKRRYYTLYKLPRGAQHS